MLTETLAAMRQYLRPGARLVLWTDPDGHRSAKACAQHMQRLRAESGFISIIVGQVASDVEDVVVATGILSITIKK